jgi:UDP-2,3-diacylglucosamine pyrophosphatase LpxH
MIPIPSFDQLYVISDLHMGGPVGHRIFGQEDLLSKFIDHLRDHGRGDCALVINGDIVDFLVERGATYFDPAGAIEKLAAIRESFPKVWQSLKEYVGVQQRHLVVTLGNHDLELAARPIFGLAVRPASGLVIGKNRGRVVESAPTPTRKGLERFL